MLLYLTAWLAFALGARVSGEWQGEIVAPLTVLYFAILSLLIGSLASAQERQFGTADAQMLVPVSASRQWAVKAATAIGLAMALGVGVPAVLDRMAPAADMQRLFRGGAVTMLSIMAVLTASSLYVSSLCRSGVTAMVFSFPAIVGALLIVQTVGWKVFLAAQDHQVHLVYRASMDWTVPAFNLGIIVLLLWLGARNHRLAEAGFARICCQGLLIGTYLTAGALVIGALAAL